MQNIMPLAKNEVVLRPEGDEALLYNPNTGSVQILNQLGVFIWKLCDGKHTKDQIVKMILENYEVATEDKVKEELEIFLCGLIRFGLIQEN